jgi:hypothetical protein
MNRGTRPPGPPPPFNAAAAQAPPKHAAGYGPSHYLDTLKTAELERVKAERDALLDDKVSGQRPAARRGVTSLCRHKALRGRRPAAGAAAARALDGHVPQRAVVRALRGSRRRARQAARRPERMPLSCAPPPRRAARPRRDRSRASRAHGGGLLALISALSG